MTSVYRFRAHLKVKLQDESQTKLKFYHLSESYYWTPPQSNGLPIWEVHKNHKTPVSKEKKRFLWLLPTKLFFTLAPGAWSFTKKRRKLWCIYMKTSLMDASFVSVAGLKSIFAILLKRLHQRGFPVWILEDRSFRIISARYLWRSFSNNVLGLNKVFTLVCNFT